MHEQDSSEMISKNQIINRKQREKTEQRRQNIFVEAYQESDQDNNEQYRSKEIHPTQSAVFSTMKDPTQTNLNKSSSSSNNKALKKSKATAISEETNTIPNPYSLKQVPASLKTHRPTDPKTIELIEQSRRQEAQKRRIEAEERREKIERERAEIVRMQTERLKQIQEVKDNHMRKVKFLLQKCEELWIFFITDLSNTDMRRIKALYSDIKEDEPTNTICRQEWELQQYFQIENSSCLINVVVSYERKKAIPFYKHKHHINRMILYYPDQTLVKKYRIESARSSQKTMNQEIIFNLPAIIEQAEQYIEPYKIFWRNLTLESDGFKQQPFVNYFKVNKYNMERLSDYRNILYAAKNLDEFEFQRLLGLFNSYSRLFIQKNYEAKFQQTEKQTREFYYKEISHDNSFEQRSISKLKKLLGLYAKESYFYEILNIKLKTFRAFNEFQKCSLPFYELYHTIHFLYLQNLKEEQKVGRTAFEVFRGCKGQKQFQLLQVGDLIETTGFLSTSKDSAMAMRYCDAKAPIKYLFKINVPKMDFSQEAMKYDGGGFIELPKIIPDHLRSHEEEVLFNSLNIFQVASIKKGRRLTEKPNQIFNVIQLQYAPIVKIAEKNFKSKEQFQILRQIDKLRAHQANSDQGDVHIKNQDFHQGAKFYQSALKKWKQSSKTEGDQRKRRRKIGIYTYKLSECLILNKQSEQAQQTINNYVNDQQNTDFSDRDQSMRVYAFHLKSIDLKIKQKMNNEAEIQINKALDKLQWDRFQQRAELLMKRAEIRFVEGRIQQAYDDFNQIDIEVKRRNTAYQRQRQPIEEEYEWEKFKLWITFRLSDDNLKQISAKRQQQLEKISNRENALAIVLEEHAKRCAWMNNKIQENAKMRNIDPTLYKDLVEKGYFCLQKMRERMSKNPNEKIKYTILQAEINNSTDEIESEDNLRIIQNFVRENQNQLSQSSKARLFTLLGDMQEKLQNLTFRKYDYINTAIHGEESVDIRETIHKVDREHYKEAHKRVINNYEKAIEALKKLSLTGPTLSLSMKIANIKKKYFNDLEDSFDLLYNLRKQYQNANIVEVADLMILLTEMAIEKGEIRFANDEIGAAERKMRDVARINQQAAQYYENTNQFLQIELIKKHIYIRQKRQNLMTEDQGGKNDHTKIVENQQATARNNIEENIKESFQPIFAQLQKIQNKCRVKHKQNIFMSKDMIAVEELRARMQFRMKNLRKTEQHYNNVVRLVQTQEYCEIKSKSRNHQQQRRKEFKLGKVYCAMAKCFYSGFDFIFGMKYMLKAEKQVTRSRQLNPDTWSLYHLFYFHKHQQQIAAIHYDDTRNIEKLMQDSLTFIQIANSLSDVALDRISISRFEVRACFLTALLQNGHFVRAFSEYTKIFADLQKTINKSYGYKKIQKPDDDEKVLFLNLIMKFFINEYQKGNFEEISEISEEQLKWWVVKTQNKQKQFEMYQFSPNMIQVMDMREP